MPTGLQVFNADGTIEMDTNSKTCIFTQVISLPAIPWVKDNPTRTHDVSLKQKGDNEDFIFIVLGSSDIKFYEYSFIAYPVMFTTLNNNTVRVTRLANDCPAMRVLVGVTGK